MNSLIELIPINKEYEILPTSDPDEVKLQVVTNVRPQPRQPETNHPIMDTIDNAFITAAEFTAYAVAIPLLTTLLVGGYGAAIASSICLTPVALPFSLRSSIRESKDL